MERSDLTTICIVTPDILGPVRNGGIGTACTFLAEELADAGHAVSILFTLCGTSRSANVAWMARYQAKGINVTALDSWLSGDRPKISPTYPPLITAYAVHDWLAERHFDIVFFMEWQGNGFYALQAKRAGLRFQDSFLVTNIHSPSLWHAVNNASFPSDVRSSLTYFMERKSVEWADAIVSPSSYMLDWVRRNNFKPPTRAYVLPNLIGHWPEIAERPHNRVVVEELVFFGRLEYRKGLVQFCDALDCLLALGTTPRKVTFLGKFSYIGQEHSGSYIARRAFTWPFPIEIHARFDQDQALDYLRGPGRLPVMPSVADNSPYTVYECLVARLPFLARNVGGVAELVDRRDHLTCLFGDNPRTLAQHFVSVLAGGAVIPRLAFNVDKNRIAWLALIDDLAAGCRLSLRQAVPTPKVSVCLTHYNRPKLLKQAVDSLLKQDYPNFEVILVDDGSPSKASLMMLDKLEPVFAKRSWRIVRQANGYLGKARNTAVRQSKGKFVLFMDDDNVALPNMISRFVQAAVSSGAELVTASFNVFSGERAPTARTRIIERFLPVGGIVSFSLVTNAIGDSNALMQRSLFNKLGGFSEDYGIGHEDFELYLRAVLAGANVCVVPEPLFWYRRNGVSMLSATHAAANRMRSFRPFLDTLPAPLAELAVLAHACAHTQTDVAAGLSNDLYCLNAEDRQLMLLGDPEAPETLMVLAKVLIKRGQTELARLLLDDLASTQGQTSIYRDSAIVQLITLARLGKLKPVQVALRTFGHSKTARLVAADACEFALAAIDGSNAAPAVMETLARHLARRRPDSVAAQLTAALALVRCGRYDEALKRFQRALSLADVAYLELRPDVGVAISRNQFPNGLTHYCSYGHNEGCIWPEEPKFVVVCRQLHSLMPRKEADSLFDVISFFAERIKL